MRKLLLLVTKPTNTLPSISNSFFSLVIFECFLRFYLLSKVSPFNFVCFPLSSKETYPFDFTALSWVLTLCPSTVYLLAAMNYSQVHSPLKKTHFIHLIPHTLLTIILTSPSFPSLSLSGVGPTCSFLFPQLSTHSLLNLFQSDSC